MGNLRNIIKLSNEDYNTLVTTGSLTKGGVTYTYNENDLYLTPDEAELPSYSSADANSVLSVDSTGALVWKAPYNGEHSNG